MRKGDPVLFWRSGQNAGIYANGIVSSRRAYQVKGKWRVDVKYTGLLEAPLLKKVLATHDSLRNLSIIRQPRGGNFKVSPAQWKMLRRLVSQERAAIPTRIFHAANQEGAFDPENTKDARERILATIVRRRGQPEFRQKLLSLYGGKCVLTGCDAEQALEAVHIQPYKGKHTNHPRNGMLMRADLHTLFDLHLIAVDTSNMTILLAPALKSTSYGILQGKNLKIPKDCPYPPSQAALDKHRKRFAA